MLPILYSGRLGSGRVFVKFSYGIGLTPVLLFQTNETDFSMEKYWSPGGIPKGKEQYNSREALI